MTLSEELKWRGLIKDKTFTDLKWLDAPRTFYLGVDVGSADSLTVGNLAVYLLALRLSKAGWRTVLLVGGATSLIGDPGGKEEERELTSREQVEKNKTGIIEQVEKLFKGQKYSIVDNYDWFKDIGYLEFLRDTGKHYSLTELVQRDYIAQRIGKGGSGISYAEFSYSLIQGYDYWYLFKHKGVELQIGGSDQWGNMISGVPLIRKKEGKEVQAMSMPLVVDKTTGKKFGKSEGGAIWLDPKKTSPSDFYQFWFNTADDSVEDYLKIFTELDKAEIEKVMREFKTDKASRHAQRVLAAEVTSLVHGKEGLKEAETAAKAITGEASSAEVSTGSGTSLVDLLVKSGLASSKTEARQLITSGGIYINGVQTKKEVIEKDDFEGGLLKLRRGKTLKNTVIVKLK